MLAFAGGGPKHPLCRRRTHRRDAREDPRPVLGRRVLAADHAGRRPGGRRDRRPRRRRAARHHRGRRPRPRRGDPLRPLRPRRRATDPALPRRTALRHRRRPAGLRRPRRRADPAHRQPHPGHREGRRADGAPAGRPRLQPGGPRRLRDVLRAGRHAPRLAADRGGLRPRRLRPTRRRPVGPAVLRGPEAVRQGAHPGADAPLPGVQTAARRRGEGVRARLRPALGPRPALLQLPQQRPGPGRPAGRAGRAPADVHGRVVRHLLRRAVRGDVPHPCAADGAGRGGEPGPGEGLVPQQPRPVGRVRGALGGLPGLDRPARRRVPARRHASQGAGRLRQGRRAAGPEAGGRKGRPRPVAERVPDGRVLRHLLAEPGRSPLGVSARRPEAADRVGRAGPRLGRGGERRRRLHGRRVQRRALAHGLGGVGPGQHPAGAGGAVRDVGQRVDEPALRLLARAPAAAAGRAHRPRRAAAGADPGGRAGRGGAVRGGAGDEPAARRLPAGDRAGRGHARHRRRPQHMRQHVPVRLPVGGPPPRTARLLRTARGTRTGPPPELTGGRPAGGRAVTPGRPPAGRRPCGGP
ncbi:putative Basic proline-rich protein [Streptomyces misionensis JCM 4497]